MGTLAPRLVLVTRPTEREQLLASHGTRGQAAFFLESRGQSLEEVEGRHARQIEAMAAVRRAMPADWTLAEARRGDLERFLFTPQDVVVALGQDGLVANLAKYLDGQPVLGVTPDPAWTEGVLTRLPVGALPALLPAVARGEAAREHRTMVEARLGDGQSLAALNEVFVGHRSHQSARYLLRYDGQEEAQSSSGIIVATGTGLTGWARSILAATNREAAFGPEARRGIFFAREPWPSRTSGAALVAGEFGDEPALSLTSRMNEGGTIFADGIEQDFLRFDWGARVEIGLAARMLTLIPPQ